MQAFFAHEQMKHDPQQFMWEGRLTHPKDVRERTDALLHALTKLDIPVNNPSDFGTAPLEAVHAKDYLTFLQQAWAEWQTLSDPGIEVLPAHSPYFNGQPGQLARPGCRPTSPIARTAWYLGDMSAPMGPHTWESTLRSAHSAIAAARAVASGQDAAYALCRPSGHHAKHDCAAGFCYVNNSALAAQLLGQAFGKVAILDVDVHHGDGTQQIFYHRNDVLTLSLHADTTTYYPFFTGYADETGSADGKGFNLNIPVAHGTGDAVWMQHFEQARSTLTQYQPQALVVALGLDAHKDDPLGVLELTDDCFHNMGKRLGTLRLPTVIVQEGGYGVDIIGTSLQAFLEGFLSGR
ncbi:MAG TPA: histone deacetylase family protein [Burkholderiaceae bacterium]|nr:histone deacetylase family protein [Burkholderiaceae bacterium]